MFPEGCTWTGCLKKTVRVHLRLLLHSSFCSTFNVCVFYSENRGISGRTPQPRTHTHIVAAIRSRCWHSFCPYVLFHFTELFQHTAKIPSGEQDLSSNHLLQISNYPIEKEYQKLRPRVFWHSFSLCSPFPLNCRRGYK